MEAPSRPPYPSDVTDDEWASVAPYPTPVDAAAPQRRHALRELCAGLRFIVRTGMQRRFVPHDLPPRAAVSRQTRRRPAAGSFDAIVHDPREVLGVARDRAP